MFCPHCGTSLPDGTSFCTACGTKINMPGAAQQSNPQPNYDYGPQQQQQQQQPNYGYATYQQQQQSVYPSVPGGAAPQGYAPIDANRNLATYILLSLVTCGIYGYWFIYMMAQDANTMCSDDGEETPGLAVYILLCFVTCGIYSLYWQYKLANRLQANAPRYGTVISEGGSDLLVWYVLGIVLSIFTGGIGSLVSYVGTNILFKNMNTLAAAYNRANGFA
ncbi:MAG: DUF4234 domain-containing protein [Atopobiaceae bacterium]|nr:DUF4234 domain-containing protein [Atopobiaceae bacterium]